MTFKGTLKKIENGYEGTLTNEEISYGIILKPNTYRKEDDTADYKVFSLAEIGSAWKRKPDTKNGCLAVLVSINNQSIMMNGYSEETKNAVSLKEWQE